jgi:predicted Zn-dependent protease
METLPGFPYQRLDDVSGFVYGRSVSLRCSYWVLALGIAATTGCGSAQGLGQATSRATQALAQAQKAGVEQDAPYEYTKAAEYLQRAREDAEHSNPEGAAEWARRSEDCSRKAMQRAKQRRTTDAELPPGYSTCGDS